MVWISRHGTLRHWYDILIHSILLDLVKKWQAVSHTHAMDKMAVVAVWMMNAMVKYGDF